MDCASSRARVAGAHGVAKGPATPHATNRHQQPSPSHSVKLSPPPHPSQPLGSPGAARTPGASHQEEPLVKSPGPPGRPPPAGLQPRGGELLFLPDQDAAHPKSISSVRAFWRGGRGGGSLLVTPGSGKPPEAGKACRASPLPGPLGRTRSRPGGGRAPSRTQGSRSTHRRSSLSGDTQLCTGQNPRPRFAATASPGQRGKGR